MMLGLSGGEEFLLSGPLCSRQLQTALTSWNTEIPRAGKARKGTGHGIIRRATLCDGGMFTRLVPVCMPQRRGAKSTPQRPDVRTAPVIRVISYEMQDPEGIMVGTN